MKHYAYYPRDFANEYTIIRAEEPGDEERLVTWWKDSAPENSRLTCVTVAELREMRSTERHARKYDPAFSGYCDPWTSVSVKEFFDPMLDYY